MVNDSKKCWLAITGICFASAVQPINFSLVTIGVPVIQKEFSASILELQWMLNIFGIVISIFLVTMGRLADTFGRKRLFLTGMLGAGCSSLMSGFASSPAWIIAAQGIMGLAGSILLPVSQALISHAFPDHERGRAIGIWASMMGTALCAGPIVGGSLISLWGWRSIFFINIPLLLIALPLILRYAKESKSIIHRGELDLAGLIVLAVAIGSLVVGIVQGPGWGWDSLRILLLLGIFILSTISLIFIERKARFPIIHPEFFLKPTFLFASLGNFCMMFYVWPFLFLIPLYLQSVRNDTPFQAGLIMLFAMTPVALFSSSVGKFYGKVGPRTPIILGFLSFLVSIVLQFFFEATSSLLLTSAGCLFFGIGTVLIWGPSTTAAISALPKDLAAVASGGFSTVQEIGGTVGLTIIGTIFRIGHPQFMVGFRYGLWALAPILVIGLLAALPLCKHKTK
jgi:EmrB/QacA subfamily drug resistance transporter